VSADLQRARRRHLPGTRAMLVARRVATQLAAATLLATSSFPGRSNGAEVAAPAAIAVFAGGFLIPEDQYSSYASALDELGCASVLYGDESTLSRPVPIADGATALLGKVEALATQLGAARSVPLVLVGHSRGCKTCVAAASRCTKRPVAALVLLDPVDSTSADPSSVLPELSRLSAVPVAILGAAKGALDCSPTGTNYETFAAALDASAPRLVGVLGKAGHTQFVDRRRVLSVDVCTTGKDKDVAVREVALATTTAWVGAALSPSPPTSERGGGARSAAQRAAIAKLRETQFAADVTWRSELA